MRNLFLVRHGESEGNVNRVLHQTVADHAIPLSCTGRNQAGHAGEFFGNWWHDGFGARKVPESRPRVWVSPYKRTRDTATYFMAGAGRDLFLDVREHVLLCEQRFGLFDGIPEDELPVRYPQEHAYYQKCLEHGGQFWAPMPLGESRFDVATRVHQAFGTFHRDADRHGVENIVVVAHGTTIRAFVMMWCHKPYEWFEDEPNPKNCSIRWIEGSTDRGYIYEGS